MNSAAKMKTRILIGNMRWTVVNASGSDARITAKRVFSPGWAEAGVVKLAATRAAIDRVHRLIGKPTHVRLGTSRPYLEEPVELMEGS